MATVASIVVHLTATTNRLEKNLGRASRMFDNFVRRTKRVTRGLDDIARYGRRAGVALTAIAGATAGLVKASAEHEEAMIRVKAISRATIDEYNSMSKAAIDLSTSTVHSIAQIDEGMKFLAMAGYEAKAIMDIMPSITKMATVGMLDMAEASRLMVGILAGYQMEITDLDRVTDILAATITGANVDLQELGNTLRYIGPIAAGAGMEFEQVAAVSALLGQANIKGSIAGTSMRSALARLLSPARGAQNALKRLNVETLDSAGNLRDFTDIIADLADSGAKTSDILQIFGLRAGPAMERLVSVGAESIREFADALRQSQGIAAAIESEQLQSLNAQLKLTRNQFRAVSTELGDMLLPYAKTLNYYVSELIGWFRELDDEQKRNIGRWVAIGSAILGLVTVLGVVAMAIGVFVKGLTVLGTVLAFVASPLILGLGIILFMVGLVKTAWDQNWGDIQEKTRAVVDKILEYWDKLKSWWETSRLKEVVAEYWESLKEIWTDDDMSFWEKMLQSLSSTKDLLLSDVSISIASATLVAVGSWKILSGVLAGIGSAIGTASGALKGGGIVIGKLAVAAVSIILGAGAIGWVFGGKEGREAFVEAVSESLSKMFSGETPLTVSLLDIGGMMFDFGSEGFRNLRSKASEAADELRAIMWRVQDEGLDALRTESVGERTLFGIDIESDLLWSALELAKSIAIFIGEGFLLVFDLGAVLAEAVLLAVETAVAIFKDLGEQLGDSIKEGLKKSAKNLFLGGGCVDAFAEHFKFYFGFGWGDHMSTGKPVFDPTSMYIPASGRMQSKQSGGYTGNHPVDQVVGVVHGQEVVIPAHAVKKGLGGMLKWLGVPGFQKGTPVSIPGLGAAKDTIATMQSMFDGLGRTILTGMAKLFELVIVAIETIGKLIFGEEKWDEIKGTLEKFKSGLKEFLDDMGDVLIKKVIEPEVQRELIDWIGALELAASTFIDNVKRGAPLIGNLFDDFFGSLEAGSDIVSALVFSLLNLAFTSEPLTEALRILTVPLSIAADLLGTSLVPVIRLIFPVIKNLAIVLGFVAIAIAGAYNALVSAINFALGWLGVNLATLPLDDMVDSFEELLNMTWDNAASMEEMNKQVNEALKNVPRGLKIISHRLAAAGTDVSSVPTVDAAYGAYLPGRREGAGEHVEVNLYGDIYGVEDLDRRIYEAVAKGKRRSGLATRGVG